MKTFMMIVLGCFCATSAIASNTWTATTTREGVEKQSAPDNWSVTRDPNDLSSQREFMTERDESRFSLMNADVTPLQISIITPVELPWGDWDVRGIRISAPYGRARNVTGLDVGVWNAATKSMTGWQIGAANIANYTRGLQTGALNCAIRLKGVQIGVINYAESACGLQLGLINVIEDSHWPFCLVFNMCF